MCDVSGQTLRFLALVRSSCRSLRRMRPERVFVPLVTLSVRSSGNVRLRSSRSAAAPNLGHVRLHLLTSDGVNSCFESEVTIGALPSR